MFSKTFVTSFNKVFKIYCNLIHIWLLRLVQDLRCLRRGTTEYARKSHRDLLVDFFTR